MPAPDAASWVRVCELDALPPTGARGFDLSGNGIDDLFLVRKGELLRGYINSCPHWPGASLPWRKHAYLDRDASHIVCHGHGARFAIDDGLCISGPCTAQYLQAVMLRIEEGKYVSVLFPMRR
ncbi:Rieske (2Fe-2S) protein [Paraburkholderia hospita]|uniref:Rieske (2Fe-2S) protein n=1 Tax=Paraburkholderia hospita TaxID=169430 RepID=UPI0008A7369E|nr:Rieske 2Fe-2S domain-containing protein [Paraburkholderia hospita]SEI20814.1 Ferredoxin subunit of nitrite reductase or a ring-hydroxylating dioxygenase [Paraburkholderia hospita]